METILHSSPMECNRMMMICSLNEHLKGRGCALVIFITSLACPVSGTQQPLSS